MHQHLHKSLLAIFKQNVVDTLWDKVNATNVGVFLAAGWGQIAVLLTVSAWTTEVAWWIQFGLGSAAGVFLLAYNILKFYRLWKSNENE